MRAYYDPDDLSEVMARLDAERGYPATVTCRVNDQRAMVMRADEQPDLAGVTPERIRQRLAETSLTWLGPRENVHEQANILIENRPGVVSLYLIWDLWSLDHRAGGGGTARRGGDRRRGGVRPGRADRSCPAGRENPRMTTRNR